jgi:ABC-type multidrug transport system fused ATPase/permease subunit
LINLILRLYDPEQGSISIDGMDLREIKLNSLRQNLAVSTQRPFLFDLSIQENMCYGRKGVSRERIIEAAKIACLHDFVSQLPFGYDTVVGEDAYRLSQGAKQRLALARAIVMNPRVLILDEATSSVDSLTEERIFRALRQSRGGLSTIVISHRLCSLNYAERIYFLKMDGALEEGTHTQLLSQSLEYKTFFHNQQACYS